MSGQTSGDRTLLVTGGSRGIGRAAALAAAKRGWRVAVNYVGDEKAAREVVEAIRAGGGAAVALQGDVSVEADVLAMFEGAARLGPLGCVVVNAGVVAPTARLTEMSAERMRRVFDINVLGSYLTAREAARRLSTRLGGPGGAVVVVSSAAARLGSPNLYVDYAGAKAALDILVKGLSIELGAEGVRVNGVRPGLIVTDIHASGGAPDRAEALGATAPMRRPGQPEEVAAAIVWLLSDEASYVTGAMLDVSGGR
ncbi:MAG: SDR family oxidoreductase [Pseudomonadota bacterium]|nr:SDR family oxidoreductase [Pseudomonadota bacterium]